MSIDLRIGTSSFSADGWVGSFYPAGMQARDFLSYYATKFDTVEVDSTYYAIPAKSTVQNWYERTPANFTFALKVPSLITHEKMLVDCGDDMKLFLETADLLQEKLGPLLLQFPYFNKAKFQSGKDFLAILKPFLASLPKDHQFALEIRNKWWLNKDFLNILREGNVAFAWIDQSWMPRPWEMKPDLDLITADFLYVRWLGDRKEIEAITQLWDKVVVDKAEDIRKWVEFLKQMIFDKKLRKLFAFANSHYAGHGPATAEQFKMMWNR